MDQGWEVLFWPKRCQFLLFSLWFFKYNKNSAEEEQLHVKRSWGLMKKQTGDLFLLTWKGSKNKTAACGNMEGLQCNE